MIIKVGYLAAYDHELIKYSIPTLYKEADKIVIAIDQNRLTFSGKPFTIDASFFTYIKDIDSENKITIYEDEFYVSGMLPMEIETRTRNMLGKFMGKGGWHLQVDVDEYFIDFKRLVDELKVAERKVDGRQITFRLYLCTIFKIADNGYYLVDESWESFPCITNHPVYESGRYNHSNEIQHLNHVVLHQSFGRTDEELALKFKNWGHRDDFDSEEYLRFWKSVTVDNCKYLANFNATHPWLWKKLKFVKADSIQELLQKIPSSYKENQPHKFHTIKKWIPPVLYNRLVKMK